MYIKGLLHLFLETTQWIAWDINVINDNSAYRVWILTAHKEKISQILLYSRNISDNSWLYCMSDVCCTLSVESIINKRKKNPDIIHDKQRLLVNNYIENLTILIISP